MNDPDRQFAGARVLVVDDTDISADLAVEMLQTLDMTCVVANEGSAALAILAADRNFDGILLDCEMPDMDGYATAQAIRAMSGLSDLPILAMTHVTSSVCSIPAASSALISASSTTSRRAPANWRCG